MKLPDLLPKELLIAISVCGLISFVGKLVFTDTNAINAISFTFATLFLPLLLTLFNPNNRGGTFAYSWFVITFYQCGVSGKIS